MPAETRHPDRLVRKPTRSKKTAPLAPEIAAAIPKVLRLEQFYQIVPFGRSKAQKLLDAEDGVPTYELDGCRVVLLDDAVKLLSNLPRWTERHGADETPGRPAHGVASAPDDAGDDWQQQLHPDVQEQRQADELFDGRQVTP